MEQKIITGANAILSLQTKTGIVPVQLCDNVTVTENTQVVPVTGVGSLYKKGMEVTGWDGSGSLSFYNGLLSESAERLALDNRVAQDIEQWTNYLLTRLKSDGAVLNIFHRVKVGETSGGEPIVEPRLFAKINNIFVTSTNFSIGENQISKVQYNFVFTEPLIYPK